VDAAVVNVDVSMDVRSAITIELPHDLRGPAVVRDGHGTSELPLHGDEAVVLELLDRLVPGPRRRRNLARILIAEDEPLMRRMLQRALESDGRCVVAVVPTAEEALELRDSFRPDLFVTDNQLPGISGLDLARCLREAGDGTPIVLHSAYLTPEVVRDAERIGINAVAAKRDLKGLLARLDPLIRRVLDAES
jgi:CheY-like chemotaxis protein